MALGLHYFFLMKFPLFDDELPRFPETAPSEGHLLMHTSRCVDWHWLRGLADVKAAQLSQVLGLKTYRCHETLIL